MFSHSILITLLLISYNEIQLVKAACSIRSILKTFELIPDVIDSYPLETLTVTYQNESLQVNLGNELTPTQAKDLPELTWNADSNSYYSIFFVDPDGPSRANATNREYLHWMVVNVHGNDISSGEAKFQYFGPGASYGSGLHRYVFLVYKQDGLRDFSFLTVVPNNSRTGRRAFKNRIFAQNNGFGPLIGINFFQAQYDDYVPILQATFIN